MHSRTIMAIGVTSALATAAAAQGLTGPMQPVPVYVNGEQIGSEALLLKNVNRTVLPMRVLFESLGARVEWDPSQRAVYAWKPDGNGVRLAMGEHTAHTMVMNPNPGAGSWGRVTGSHRLQAPPMMVGGRIFVPLRFASEALAADVRYAAFKPAVYIETQAVAGYRAEDPPVVDERDFEPPVRRPRQRVDDFEPPVRIPRDEFEPPVRRPRVVEDEPIVRPRIEPELTAREIASGLELRVEVPNQRFNLNDEVPVRFVIRNRSDRELTIPFRTGQRFDVEVLQENQLIWNWSAGRSFPQAAAPVTLQPGEEVSYNARWKMQRTNGRNLSPGRYTLRATLMADFQEPALTAERVIRVTDR